MTQPSNDDKPLDGLNIIELQAIGPVPFAGSLLRSLGARIDRIMQIRDPGLGIGMKPEFDVLNHDKQVVHIDLKTKAGVADLLGRVKRADVLLEGFRPGVLERLGLSPETLLAANPRLVIGRLSGWGVEGPFAARAGHDINYLAIAGVLHAIGLANAPPVPPLNLVADYGGGAMHLVVGVLAKLIQRSVSGRGGVVSTSILAGTLGLTASYHGMIAGGKWTLSREDNLLDGAVPFYRCYETADGKHISVGAIEPKFYAELVTVLGLQGQVSLDEQYDKKAWPTTQAKFSAAIAGKTRDQWAVLAGDRDACLAPVLNWAEAAVHPHNVANHWFGSATIGPSGVIDFA